MSWSYVDFVMDIFIANEEMAYGVTSIALDRTGGVCYESIGDAMRRYIC